MTKRKPKQNNIRSKRETTTTYKRFNSFFKRKWVDANQHIKMLQIALQYTLPRIKQAANELSEGLPLFV